MLAALTDDRMSLRWKEVAVENISVEVRREEEGVGFLDLALAVDVAFF